MTRSKIEQLNKIYSLEEVSNLPKGKSLFKSALSRLFANKAAVTSMIVLVLIVLTAIIAPMFKDYDSGEVFWDAFLEAPSKAHWFGTDANGRDMFVRTMDGIQVSLLVAFSATAVSFLIGISYGAIAGYVGGRVDNIMMRIVDILYALPFMFIVILLMVFFGRNIYLMFAALGLVEWLTMARIVRGQALSLSRKEFVIAADAMGVRTKDIIYRHIIPNTLGLVMVYITLTIPAIILAESFLSFLGLGVQEPMTSLGVLISEGANSLETAPWILLFPGAILVIMLFCFNFIGDGLRDAFDPKDR